MRIRYQFCQFKKILNLLHHSNIQVLTLVKAWHQIPFLNNSFYLFFVAIVEPLDHYLDIQSKTQVLRLVLQLELCKSSNTYIPSKIVATQVLRQLHMHFLRNYIDAAWFVNLHLSTGFSHP